MRRIFRLVTKVARTDSTVLLTGESGPFVPVNLGALPESLVESELFGTARGAFTGATIDRPGLIEAADGGTLFLDEIGDMPLASQAKLLRTLESNEVRRLGETSSRLVDVRVIAATHRDLQRMAAEGRFREDLYYRLNVVQIDLPPLRERREDIGLLASYFLDRIARREGRNLRFSPAAAAMLERHDFPGNVRELENAIEHAVAVSEGDIVRPDDLPAAIRAPRLLPQARPDAEPGGPPAPALEPAAAAARDGWSIAEVEKEHIQRVLERHRGNATTAARQLGISRTTLWRKLRLYGLRRPGA
jgi:transcriptional regulator with PAS, ATPase and Fis domain